ncbi:4708_t:CDS:2, partial [Dentiscutata erythropus]
PDKQSSKTSTAGCKVAGVLKDNNTPFYNDRIRFLTRVNYHIKVENPKIFEVGWSVVSQKAKL